ncbi:MAG: hypothetical protein QM606_05720, partial [Leucobacter sp.]
AVRSAELLRGALVRCGPGVRPVGWPDVPRVRAAALAPWLSADRIAIRMCAAWIWGAAREPGLPLEFSTTERRRPGRREHPDHLLHQFAYDERALHRFDGFALTAPEQTLHDLLRIPEAFSPDRRVACRLLLRLVEGGRDRVEQRIGEQRGPFRTLARTRLALL